LLLWTRLRRRRLPRLPVLRRFVPVSRVLFGPSLRFGSDLSTADAAHRSPFSPTASLLRGRVLPSPGRRRHRGLSMGVDTDRSASTPGPAARASLGISGAKRADAG